MLTEKMEKIESVDFFEGRIHRAFCARLFYVEGEKEVSIRPGFWLLQLMLLRGVRLAHSVSVASKQRYPWEQDFSNLKFMKI